MVSIANKVQAEKIQAPSSAVDNLIANTVLPQEARASILQYFLGDCDATRFGLSLAVSRYRQDLEDADKAADVEELAGRILKRKFVLAL